MGRDEHRNPRGRNRLAQTPKNLKSDGIDVEFSEAVADEEDKQAQERANRADMRVKNQDH
ncbi:YfhD family protein [Virgibacillus sp. 179-BFC.A HS]|uniref:YfhD family protein n=1 Tax=Tigheibacillus jepli TaxID=3035914 RepID=A0ABU5CMJ0_9BACI|nr:YfhD family protein [Virgibacillus sp. 179-BFC.A HS]MDY0407009.1 YfhD family protein [Virgibacillus sp. 179-BFC.A HS]